MKTAVALAVALALGASTPQADAQRPTDRATARRSLDVWIVTRYRDAQLLDDSLATGGTAYITGSVATTALPRIEATHEAPSGDTVFALHFGADGGQAALRPAALVRLSGPSGTITSHLARIVVRRAFRSPRVPKANTSSEDAWRLGWAYLAVISQGARPTPSVGYRGWLLLAIPDSGGSKSPTKRPHRR